MKIEKWEKKGKDPSSSTFIESGLDSQAKKRRAVSRRKERAGSHPTSVIDDYPNLTFRNSDIPNTIRPQSNLLIESSDTSQNRKVDCESGRDSE